MLFLGICFWHAGIVQKIKLSEITVKHIEKLAPSYTAAGPHCNMCRVK